MEDEIIDDYRILWLCEVSQALFESLDGSVDQVADRPPVPSDITLSAGGDIVSMGVGTENTYIGMVFIV